MDVGRNEGKEEREKERVSAEASEREDEIKRTVPSQSTHLIPNLIHRYILIYTLKRDYTDEGISQDLELGEILANAEDDLLGRSDDLAARGGVAVDSHLMHRGPGAGDDGSGTVTEGRSVSGWRVGSRPRTYRDPAMEGVASVRKKRRRSVSVSA